ncbi:MAG: SprB repeat-containing protein, partial [Flavobacteriales bacterium]|nr:SprB repeat-containing protein [Flavobacteriales bacterium]
AAGYYRVAVYDNNGGSAQGEITLGEPEQLMGTATAFEYPNDFHVSCHSCYNGSIDAGAVGGVAPYTYEWKDGPTVEDRSGLGARDYTVVVRDANGCEAEGITLLLREPQRNDWTMNGNAGTIPGPHYIGTSDNMDVVFKSNGIERFRLLASGEVKIAGLGDGLLRASGGIVSVASMGGEPFGEAAPFWSTSGNWLTAEPDQFLGTRDAHTLSIRTNDVQRMLVTTGGQVGIGADLNTVPGLLTVRSGAGEWIALQNEDNGQDLGAWHFTNTSAKDRLQIRYVPDGQSATSDVSLWNNGKVSIGPAAVGADPAYRLYVEGGIVARDVKVTVQPFPDYVFKADYPLRSLADLAAYLRTHQHLPSMPSATEVEAQGGVELGDLQRRMLQVLEEQALYILQLKDEIDHLKARVNGQGPTK